MDVGKWRNDRGEIWLNVASGAYPQEGFVNLDNSLFLKLTPLYFLIRRLSPKHGEVVGQFRELRKRYRFVIHDCRKTLWLPDESVDHILCSHFVEHVYPDEGAAILRDFHRVLKRSGTLHLIVPDLEGHVASYTSRGAGRDSADALMDALLLSQRRRPSLTFRILELLGGYGLQHRWMYDRDSTCQLLEGMGFVIRGENRSPSARWRADEEEPSVNLLAEKQ